MPQPSRMTEQEKAAMTIQGGRIVGMSGGAGKKEWIAKFGKNIDADTQAAQAQVKTAEQNYAVNGPGATLSQSDLPKSKDGPGYQAADGRTAYEVGGVASSWSVGACALPDIIEHEGCELSEAANVPCESTYSASMYAGNANVKKQLDSPANKRGPKTGANGPFDSANMTGAELNQSYLDDPPISGGGSMGMQTAGAPGSTPGRTNGNSSGQEYL